MSSVTCRKIYTDIPWAHRQHRHDGHCAQVHGHNWSIAVTFGCTELDPNGFVVDFGRLKYLRAWIDEHLDHACVFNREDPLREALVAIGGARVWKPYVVDCCSCEGMAQHLWTVFDRLVRAQTQSRAFVVSVELTEDSRNSALYVGDGQGSGES